jgi:hypothetical protein
MLLIILKLIKNYSNVIMESLDCVIEDPLIKSYLKRFPCREWNEVIKKTLRLGIHSMNALKSLSLANTSPEKNVSVIEIDNCQADDSTVVLAGSLNKNDQTPPSKDRTKIIRKDSKLPKKKKALSQVAKVSKATPKSKRAGFEHFKEKKESKRLNSLKTSKPKKGFEKYPQDHKNNNTAYNSNNRLSKELQKENKMQHGYTKSFKSLKFQSKYTGVSLSPKNFKIPLSGCKNSLDMQDLNEFYKNNKSARHQQVDFPLKIKNNLDSDPFVYVTSSSEETS